MVIIGAVGLTGSWAASAAVDRTQQRHAGQVMDQYADAVNRAVTAEADRYRDTLSDLAAAVTVQSDLSNADFLQITSKLTRQRLPGVAGVAFVVPADHTNLSGVQAHWRAKGASGLTLVPQGSADEHFFIVFNSALDGSATTAGSDLSRAVEPADALRTCRASGQVTASLTYVLLVDRERPADQQQMSFLLAAPVFAGMAAPDAGRFRGWVVMGMRGGDFMQETLQRQSQGAVRVTLLDRSTATPTVVARPPADTPAATSRFNRERTVIVGQRRWELRLEPTKNLVTGADRRMPAVTLGIGVLITLLVAAMVGILSGARNRAMDKVDQATAALQDDIRRRARVEAQLRERESELHHRTLHDPLTGLANRVLFHERVDHAIATHDRGATTLAVLFVDLDGFKKVNDTFGHGTGDALLSQVAVRLRECTRGSDTVGRFGGDEFAILAEQISTVEDATVVAGRIVSSLQCPFTIDDHICHVTASAGIAIYRDGDTADTIIRRADEAMYTAKAAGKNHYALARI